MVRASINNKICEFKDNSTILEAARSLGIEVPTPCHDERLTPAGACRLCVVEVEGWPHLAVSCHTPLTDGMTIKTETAELQAERKGVLSLLAHRYPKEALHEAPDKPFNRYLKDYGLIDHVGRDGFEPHRHLPSLHSCRYEPLHLLLHRPGWPDFRFGRPVPRARRC
ncbi:MAG TPA: 2Fe-2S iron-sulfur cluster-binding protein [Candidatus Binatia bacterium]|jgi:hypothetical protein|nr:2Fe-2S iron-sulfur cluster-binding protein [Candidatus Binatia bacterium]